MMMMVMMMIIIIIIGHYNIKNIMGLVGFDYFLTCARDFHSEPISWTLWCWRIVELYYKKN
jgi:hypothetical protein